MVRPYTLSNFYVTLKNSELITRYADDNYTLYWKCYQFMQEPFQKLLEWLLYYQAWGTVSKYLLIISSKENAEVQAGNSSLENSYCEKLLAAKIDSPLSFEGHIKTISIKASNELRLLPGVKTSATLKKCKYRWISLLISNLKCIRLIWMLHSINNICTKYNKTKYLMEYVFD